jgi:hypothetical protein
MEIQGSNVKSTRYYEIIKFSPINASPGIYIEYPVTHGPTLPIPGLPRSQAENDRDSNTTHTSSFVAAEKIQLVTVTVLN